MTALLRIEYLFAAVQIIKGCPGSWDLVFAGLDADDLLESRPAFRVTD